MRDDGQYASGFVAGQREARQSAAWERAQLADDILDDFADLADELTQADAHDAAEQVRGYVRHWRDQLGAVQ